MSRPMVTRSEETSDEEGSDDTDDMEPDCELFFFGNVVGDWEMLLENFEEKKKGKGKGKGKEKGEGEKGKRKGGREGKEKEVKKGEIRLTLLTLLDGYR